MCAGRAPAQEGARQDLVERDLVSVEPLLTPAWNAKVNDGRIRSWAAASCAPSVLFSVAPDTGGRLVRGLG